MARRVRADRTSQAEGPPVRLVRSGETRVAYTVLGDVGSMVLLLQPFWVGMENTRTDLGTFGPQLSGKHRVIVHDRRGTGESDRHPGQVSVGVQVADLLAILDELAVQRVQVVAMTEAAPLAVSFAAAHPERVSRMAVIDPHLRPRVGPGSAMLLHTLHSRPRVGLKAFARSLVDDDVAAETLAEGMTARMDAATAARLYEAFLQADALPAAAAVRCRTLLAFGVHDRMVVEEEARGLKAHFPDAQIGVISGTPGTPSAAREAWVEMQDFLDAATAASVSDEVAHPRRASMPISVPLTPLPVGGSLGDYIPAGSPPRVRHVSATLSSHALQPNMLVRWGPPAQIPHEAIEFNRKAVDHILLGEIEEALTAFQKAMEISPEYEDAAINYRELLSRLVQRRVAQWQTQQAEEMLTEAERRAERYAKTAKRRGLARWLSLGGQSA